nr:PREDICTED: HD domain-containing protein 2-like [Pelecanus crispus]
MGCVDLKAQMGLACTHASGLIIGGVDDEWGQTCRGHQGDGNPHRKEPFSAEYENQCTAEAKFVKQLDQCEMILQAFEYEELENTPGRLQDFYDSTAGKFVHPEILQLVSLINTERNKKIAATSHPHS